MRPRGFVAELASIQAILLVCVGLVGCANRQTAGGTWLDRFRALRPGFNAEAVQIDVSLVRQHLGDPYINHELWDMVDEQALPLDQKPMLASNGYRIGTVGSVPAGLQKLLTHDADDADLRRATKTEGNGASARRITIRLGHPYFLTLGPADRPAKLKVTASPQSLQQAGRGGGEATRLDLEKTQFGLFIQPSISEDGDVVLRFEPGVRHGEGRLPRPSEDRSDWTLFSPEERFPALGWEIGLKPNEYLIVGGLLQQPGTLGHYSFVQDDMEKPGQWLLVIRTYQPQSNQVTAHHYAPQDAGGGAKKRSALPLALQSMLPKGQPIPARKSQSEPKIRAESP
jgi:hypothetical protein